MIGIPTHANVLWNELVAAIPLGAPLADGTPNLASQGAVCLEHIDAAIIEFRDMHMQPGLERAVALSEMTEPRLSSQRSDPV